MSNLNPAVRTDRSWWREALRLTGDDARRHWLSYPAAAVVAVPIGALSATLFNGVFVVEGAGPSGETFEARLSATMAGYFMLAASMSLVVNMLLNPDLAPSFRTDNNFTRKLVFLRSLPISTGTVVLGRMLAMALTIPAAAPAFFGVFYLVARPSGELPGMFGFVCFALMWIGYALLVGGGLVYLWMSRGRRAWITMAIAGPLTFMLVGLVGSLAHDTGVVGWTVESAARYGILAGLAGLLIGIAGFALGGWLTARRLDRRGIVL